jgi:ketosteroid isomerase-like protein
MRSIHLMSIAFLIACGPSSSSTGPTTPPSDGSAPPTDGSTPTGDVGDGDTSTTPPPSTAKALPLEERIKIHDKCFEDWIKEDASHFARCYGPESSEEMVDAGQPPSKGPDKAQEFAKSLWDGFTLGGEPLVTLGNGDNDVVNVYAVWGTHDGKFGELEPTKKKMGIVVAEVQNLLPDGKHGTVKLYMDPATMQAQLTSPKKARKPVGASGKERAYAISTGSEVETANLQAVTKGFELWNARDLKGLQALYAKDAVLSDQPATKDIKGAPNVINYFKKGQKAFTDGKLSTEKIWAAGDWVVAEGTFTGTNDGVWPELGITKKTGKPVTLHSLHLFRLQEGKVKEHWMFSNGLAMITQLDLLPKPKEEKPAKPEKGGAAKPEKGAAKPEKGAAKPEKTPEKTPEKAPG